MKNFWLDRNKKRLQEEKIIYFKKKLRKIPGYTKGALKWPQQKKDTKIRQ